MKRLALLLALFAVTSASALAAGAQAATTPSLLTEIGSLGTGAGQMKGPNGVATDPTGHIFVADMQNDRIVEFTPWGEFVKAFGWDVAPGAVDEEQEVRVRATAGEFRLTFGADTTPGLPFDASAAEVEAALNSLASIGAGGVTVEGGPGGIEGTTPAVYVIHFDSDSFAAGDVDEIGAANGAEPLSGGAPTALEVFTRADGTAAKSGLEACTQASGCQAGSRGAGAGQFRRPGGIAVDGERNVYTFERDYVRVQKFDAAGRFLWMVGGGVNETTGAEICTAADVSGGDACGAGDEGTGPREFSSEAETGAGQTLNDYIELSPGGALYVGDRNRIQKIGSDGSFLQAIDLVPAIGSGDPGSIAVDPVSGDIYFSFGQGVYEKEWRYSMYRLSPTGALVDTLEVKRPQVLATDPQGNLYVVEIPKKPEGNPAPARVVAFDPGGDVLIPYEESGVEASHGTRFSALATNRAGNLIVSNPSAFGEAKATVDVYGPGPVALEPPPKVPPAISDQWATAVDTDGATVRAAIDPKFWADTRYLVEYGTEDCEAGGCTAVPAPPGSLLTDEVVAGNQKTPGVFLSSLQPGTTYHYRFVAESSGGGPVFGPDATFMTAQAPTGHAGECSGNEALRSGPSAGLPDCRAFEMVSPVDKNGGDLSPICENLCYQANLDQSAEAGSALTYSSYKSFGDAESAPYLSQYLARRTAGGWQSDGITPALGDPLLGAAEDLDTPFKAFTPDLATAWFTQIREPDLDPSGGAPNIYRRDNAEDTYQALSPEAMGSYPELQAVTPDGRCAVFRVLDVLTEDAKPELTQVYRSCDGQLDLVSILPSGTASAKASSAGTAGGSANGREQSVFNAISDHGTRVFWSEPALGGGPLYLRLFDREETISIAKNSVRFQGASSDGSRAVYDEAGKLVEVAIDSEGVLTKTTIANEVLGVPGMSEDAGRVYFVSKADLDGEGAAAIGKPNLYLHEVEGEEATTSYVATLTEADVDASSKLRPIDLPNFRLARTNPAGSHLVFMSSGRLTGFDNTDQNSGEADAEIFLYDSEADEGAGKLVCASCNPSGARPVGRELPKGIKGSQPSNVWAAARIPTYVSQLYGSRVLSNDGTRLYFESYEPLTPLDTNGQGDVYQWEELGTGTCSAEDSSFQEQSGGCVELISSGKSPSDSTFVDASADGTDVFIRTASSLLPQDPALVDIYDAREGGGFPPPPAPPAACEGEACQGPLAAPNDPTPASQAFDGPGNVKPQGTRPRCPKGKVRRKGRCVKKGKGKRGKQQNRTNQNRRAGR